MFDYWLGIEKPRRQTTKQTLKEMPLFPFPQAKLQSNTSPSPFLAATPLVFSYALSFPIPRQGDTPAAEQVDLSV